MFDLAFFHPNISGSSLTHQRPNLPFYEKLWSTKPIFESSLNSSPMITKNHATIVANTSNDSYESEWTISLTWIATMDLACSWKSDCTGGVNLRSKLCSPGLTSMISEVWALTRRHRLSGKWKVETSGGFRWVYKDLRHDQDWWPPNLNGPPNQWNNIAVKIRRSSDCNASPVTTKETLFLNGVCGLIHFSMEQTLLF